MSFKSKTLSVYGGAGGRGTRISTPSSSRGFNLADAVDVTADEKATMQNLNGRLASYLTKVHSLEKSNSELEKKIKEWYESHTYTSTDHSKHSAVIEDLKEKIHSFLKNNGRIILAIDNAKLAADDFKTKYESELAMRKIVEADIAGLKKWMDELTLGRSDLEMNIEGLNEELIFLKKNHKEEMALVRTEAGQVNVCVDAAPSMDLQEAMTEIREHYEAVTEKNRKELESWYQKKICKVEQEAVTHTEELQVSMIQLKDLRIKLQKLEIELQAQQSMRYASEDTLEETQARSGTQLTKLQGTVTGLEHQLSLFHANIANTKQEYDVLLDIKARLEREIAEYRRLLDGEER
ncbi:keratin, type I cytoskeletal 13-like [Paramisgurnus dabryanus]|uniref:keratin, type I cytoskeletal 13-like n=1 Tax=Paramisgurnus dabryanus TaxID=90735 RepID=UPI0031F44CE1